MKKIFFTLVVLTLAMTSCKKKGCTDATATNRNAKAKKDDGSCLYRPFLTINGQAQMTINVGGAYSDAGATAVNKDGSSVAVSTDSSGFNKTQTGVYYINYAAANVNGTTTGSRKVTVVIGASNWTNPTWAVTSTCSGTTFPLSNSPVISAGAGANGISIDNMFNLVGGTATGTVNGTAISLPNQTINITLGDIIFSGIGTMNATATQFQVTYTYDNTTPLIGGNGTCVAIYDKQ
jgi:hypothetical protein